MCLCVPPSPYIAPPQVVQYAETEPALRALLRGSGADCVVHYRTGDFVDRDAVSVAPRPPYGPPPTSSPHLAHILPRGPHATHT